MLILRIGTSAESKASAKNLIHNSFIDISIKNWDKNSTLKLNNDFMIQRYGFEISKYDRDCFLTHYTSWQTFEQSDEKYCLILEDTTSVNSFNDDFFDKMQILLEENKDWDIFFPFDYTNGIDDKRLSIGYILGYHWGSDAYFISKKGVSKLLKIQEIKQPVDEEILYLSLTEDLEVYYKDTQLFNFNNNWPKEKSRKNAIRNGLFNSNVWTKESKEKIISLISEVSGLAEMAHLDLALADGSLLGYIRHNGIMPWDDDVDFCIDIRFLNSFKYFIEKNSMLKTKTSPWGATDVPYLKIWDESGKSIEGHSHKWPFVDVWPYYHLNNEIVFPHGKKYPFDIFYPFSNVQFEGSSLKLQSHPQKCLDILYSDWRTSILVFPWNHQEEKNINIPLRLEIDIDNKGRMLEDISE